jgi:hypothetical protein
MTLKNINRNRIEEVLEEVEPGSFILIDDLTGSVLVNPNRNEYFNVMSARKDLKDGDRKNKR